MNASQRLAMYRKWVRWMTRVESDVLHQFSGRVLWNGFLTVMKANPAEQQQSHYPGWMAENHALTLAVAIRRQTVVDRRNRDINLTRVLCEVRDNPEVLSAARFVSQYPMEHRGMAQDSFRPFADSTGVHVSPAMVRNDLAQLQRDSRRVKRFVDTRVAHLNRWPQKRVPTYGDLHKTLEKLGEVFKKYDMLIRRKGWANLEPVPQYDVLDAFKHAWLPNGSRGG